MTATAHSESSTSPDLDQFTPLFEPLTSPLGFEAGDTNLYRYVGNGPLNKTDPSGLAESAVPIGGGNPYSGLVPNAKPVAKATLVAILNAREAESKGSLFYKLAGIDTYFNNLRFSLSNHVAKVEEYELLGAQAQWLIGPNTILLSPAALKNPKINSDAVIEELVHATDDMNRWYLRGSTWFASDFRAAEILGEGSTIVLSKIEQSLNSFEVALKNNFSMSDSIDFINLTCPGQETDEAYHLIDRVVQDRWLGVWRNLTSIKQVKVGYNVWAVLGDSEATIGVQGVRDIKSKLGLGVTYEELRSVYQKEVDRTLNQMLKDYPCHYQITLKRPQGVDLSGF